MNADFDEKQLSKVHLETNLVFILSVFNDFDKLLGSLDLILSWSEKVEYHKRDEFIDKALHFTVNINNYNLAKSNKSSYAILSKDAKHMRLAMFLLE